MAENSKIEWTDHTFNPWWGCTKVSQGCKHCYAETFASNRTQWKNLWGPSGERRRTSEANWRKPLKWDREAAAEGVRRKVFCASMADVFEDRPELYDWRVELFDLIDATPHLDWLLLTKRPENVAPMTHVWRYLKHHRAFASNVWIGTSVEDQKTADERIPHLLEIPATVRFLSVEPLLGPVDLFPYLIPHFAADDPRHFPRRNGVEWVIVGGESGPGARPMKQEWVRSIRDDCHGTGTAFFFKQICDQHGRKLPYGNVPSDLQRREFPCVQGQA